MIIKNKNIWRVNEKAVAHNVYNFIIYNAYLYKG